MFVKKEKLEEELKAIYELSTECVVYINDEWKKGNAKNALDAAAHDLKVIAQIVRGLIDKDYKLKRSMLVSENEINQALTQLKSILSKL